MKSKIEISIGSVDYREELTAELIYEDKVFAEISQDKGELLIEFYPRRDGQPWSFSYEEILQALQKAKAHLLGK